MRVFESSRARWRSLSATLLVSLAFTVYAMVDWSRSADTDVSNWYFMRVGISAFLTIFAVLWAVSVLFLLFTRAVARL